jgi:chitinase
MKMMMNKAVACICLLAAITGVWAAGGGKPQRVVIGYVGGYRGLADVGNIKAAQLTHINYAFVDVQANRAVLHNEKTDTVNLRRLLELKKINPSLRLLISIGGWAWSGNFSDAVLSDSSRAVFAASAVALVRRYSLDGIDIDWEYPGLRGATENFRPVDGHNYTLMFKALRNSLDSLQASSGRATLLTTAVGAFPAFIGHTEMKEAQRYLDYVNLMTYDYSGNGIAAHHAGLYLSKKYRAVNSADSAVRIFIKAGVPASKLVLGLPFYGRVYQLAADAEKGLGDKMIAPLRGYGYGLLKDSVFVTGTFRLYKDRSAGVPYAFDPQTDRFITYDDAWSIRQKCRFALKEGLAGVMFWEYGSDPKGYLLDVVTSVVKKR